MAMIGTIFSVTAAILLVPPIKINAAMTATAIPIVHDGIPKAF